MVGGVVAQAGAELSLPRVITALSIVLSIGSLSVAFWKARAVLPLRPAFDLLRLVVQVVAVLVMGRLSGVSTAAGLLVGAALLGAGLGVLQGQNVEVSVNDGRVWLRRSLLGVAVWGGGLVLMQVAGLANRAGAVRIGQAVAWLSIGVTIGLLAGRQPRIGEAVRVAGLSAVVALIIGFGSGIVVLIESGPAAAQTTCPTAPSGWSETFSEFDGNCSYESAGGSTAAVSASGGRRCGVDLAEAWARFPGSPGAGSDINIRDDGSNGFEKWLVLTPNAVISIAANNVIGPGTAQNFLPAAQDYARINYAACESSPPTTTGSGTSPPLTTSPPRTTIVTEVLPSDPPPVATIEDEGAALTSTAAVRTTTTTTTTTIQPATTSVVATTTSLAESVSSTAPSTDPKDTDIALPPIGGDSSDVDLGEEDVTDNEAAQQAVAGLLMSALAGLIGWAEAFQAIDVITGQSPGTAQATYGHWQQEYPDAGQPPTPPPSTASTSTPTAGGPSPGSIPSSDWLPGTPEPGAGGGTPTPGGVGGPPTEPDWVNSGPTPTDSPPGSDEGGEPSWVNPSPDPAPPDVDSPEGAAPSAEPASPVPEPAAVPVGTESYYEDRLADFRSRNPGVEPPAYYENYGDKYLERFTALGPDLSPAGRQWMERTLGNLQETMERERMKDPERFAQMELDGDAFTRFAYDSHPTAYIEGGLFELPASDLAKIVTTPDAADLITGDGVRQIVDVLQELEGADIADRTLRSSGASEYVEMAGNLMEAMGKAGTYAHQHPEKLDEVGRALAQEWNEWMSK